MDDKPMTKEECAEAKEAIAKGHYARVQHGAVIKYIEVTLGRDVIGHRGLVLALHKTDRRLVVLALTGDSWGRLIELHEPSMNVHPSQIGVLTCVPNTEDWIIVSLMGIGATKADVEARVSGE